MRLFYPVRPYYHVQEQRLQSEISECKTKIDDMEILLNLYKKKLIDIEESLMDIQDERLKNG